MPNPFAPAESYLGIAWENVARGTAASIGATGWVPVRSPDWTQNTKFLEDKGYRGSMVDTYGWVEGVKFGEYSFQGDVFVDTFPHLMRGIMGGFDVESATVLGTTTTTTADAAAGATTMSVTASIAGTTVVQIGSGAFAEIRTVNSVSGAGPYTITLDRALFYAHASGSNVAVASGAFLHQQQLLNNAPTTGNQPPSYTLVDFYGPECRQFTNCMFSEVTVTGAADALLAYSAKLTGNPPTTIGAPTSAFTTTAPVPGWCCTATLGGVVSSTVMSHELSFKRPVTPKFTQTATQAPYRVFAGPLSVSGKATFLMESTAELVDFLTAVTPALDLRYDQSASAYVEFQMSQIAFTSPPKINRGSDAIELELAFDAVPNTTDAAAGGLSPVRPKILNAVSKWY